MLKPLRLLLESLRQFVIGLGPAMVMAVVCLAIQASLGTLYINSWSAVSAPEPPSAIDDLVDFVEARDWRSDAADLIGHTAGVSAFFFFHALVALILTAWLLCRCARFEALRVLRRALRGAVLLTGAAAVVFAAGYFLDDVFSATRYMLFDFTAAAMLAVWFGASALLLPARLMGHEPVIESGFLRNTVVAGLSLVPWFYASEIVGAGLRHCRDCGGMLDGGLLVYPVLGAYLLGLTVSSAAVSAAACMPARKPPVTAPAAVAA